MCAKFRRPGAAFQRGHRRLPERAIGRVSVRIVSIAHTLNKLGAIRLRQLGVPSPRRVAGEEQSVLGLTLHLAESTVGPGPGRGEDRWAHADAHGVAAVDHDAMAAFVAVPDSGLVVVNGSR